MRSFAGAPSSSSSSFFAMVRSSVSGTCGRRCVRLLAGLLRPAAAERLVHADQRDELVAARAGLAELGVEQRALRVEHLEVRGHAAAVAQLRELEHLALGLDARALVGAAQARLAQVHQGVLDLAEREQDGALVGVERLALLRLGHLDAPLVLPGVEDGLQEVRADRPGLRARLEQREELGALPSEGT